MSDPAHGDEELRLLGLYMVEFSQMVSEMRQQMVFRLRANPPMLGWVVFARTGPRDIQSVFFAMSRLLTEHDEEEDKIASRLESRVGREITQRNNFAHGDLQVGWWSHTGGSPQAEPLPATVMRIQVGDPPSFQLSRPDLKARCEAIARLRRMLWQYGAVCIWPKPPDSGMPQRVSDIMRLDGEDIAPGPKAAWHRA